MDGHLTEDECRLKVWGLEKDPLKSLKSWSLVGMLENGERVNLTHKVDMRSLW